MIHLSVSNISGRAKPLLEGKNGRTMRNLQIMVLPEGEDSIFIDVDETLTTELGCILSEQLG